MLIDGGGVVLNTALLILGIYISYIDIKMKIIPSLGWIGLVLIILVKAICMPVDVIFYHFGAGLSVFFLLMGLAFFFFKIHKHLMLGGGDIKVMSFLSFILGWEKIPLFFILSGLYGMIFFIATRQERIAFSPWIFCSFFMTEILYVAIR